MEAPPAIVVREVWAWNMAAELNMIQQFLQQFPYVSIDTEFPGIVFPAGNTLHLHHPSQFYAHIKRNVDALSIVQLGLTLSDSAGNMPEFLGFRHIWQFNFSDFDSESQPHNPESVELLKRQGIDFSKNRRFGIQSGEFALFFKLSGLCLRGAVRHRNLSWITFHGVYDLAFMVKILTGKQLPHDVADFISLMRLYLGPSVYDLKPVAQDLGLHGGLEAIAKRLAVERGVGRSHQAGSDSLVTMRVMVELMSRFGEGKVLGFSYKLFGLNT